MVFERSPPHLFLYLLFIQKKNKSGNKRASAGVEYQGVKFLLRQGAWNVQLPKFVVFLLLFFIIYFLFSFYYGELGMMGNFVG